VKDAAVSNLVEPFHIRIRCGTRVGVTPPFFCPHRFIMTGRQMLAVLADVLCDRLFIYFGSLTDACPATTSRVQGIPTPAIYVTPAASAFYSYGLCWSISCGPCYGRVHISRPLDEGSRVFFFRSALMGIFLSMSSMFSVSRGVLSLPPLLFYLFGSKPWILVSLIFLRLR